MTTTHNNTGSSTIEVPRDQTLTTTIFVGEIEDDHHDSYYEEVEITDMIYDSSIQTYFYFCPCGDRFAITREELQDGEDIAKCPSCSLTVRILFSQSDLDLDADSDEFSSSSEDGEESSDDEI